jgi:hypothetical protein
MLVIGLGHAWHSLNDFYVANVFREKVLGKWRMEMMQEYRIVHMIYAEV